MPFSAVPPTPANGAVARRLHISPHTVNTHRRHVFAKLGVSNRVALAAVVHRSIK
jgi:DNA-binding CsgD family transcriptional regulator